MEEQAAPLEPCRPLPPPPSALRHETYVVQVPKDQIYRVPPPENAALVEHYRNQVKVRRQNRCPCFHVLKRLLLPVFLPLFLLAAAAIIFFACVKPTTPTFSVKSLTVVKKTSKSTTEYDFSVRVFNPSNRVGLSYAAGGHAVASHHGAGEFATGSTPGFFQPQRNTTDLKLVLRSSKNLKATGKALWIKLTAKFSVNSKIGALQLWRMSLDVNCDVKVTGIDKKARVSSQDCNSNLH
ncbi:NDR1/HIN1-like protein 13 [Curcuma longa]|uniref:NDR1/HIN1-like protein 13 n=1 Tax=Curcuma longa TaxID=136217 RepID=UPI003D9E1CCA